MFERQRAQLRIESNTLSAPDAPGRRSLLPTPDSVLGPADQRPHARPRRSTLRLLFTELGVRFSLLFPGSPWRDPNLYGHQLVGDDFWILAGRWDSYTRKVDPARIHPRLGWTQGPLTTDNPLGLVRWTCERLRRDGRRKILFLGDSYVAGQAREEHWLPQLLEERLRKADVDVDVLHLGVGGYGADQMHLLLRETLPLVDRPELVLMGVMTFSFDRAAQRVRSYQKPVLAFGADGSMRVTNVPIWRSPKLYFALQRPSFASYVARARRHDPRALAASHYEFEAKTGLNRAIIAANRQFAAKHGVPLVYVLFRDHEQLHRPDRRDRFWAEELAAQGVTAFDTAAPLLEHAREHGTDGSELYANGHLNERGNAVVTAALTIELERLGLARTHRAKVLR